MYIFYSEKERGIQIRSRVKWVEEGERSTQYFLRLENTRQNYNTIKRIRTEDGNIVKTDTEILDCMGKFYSKLYSNQDVSLNDIDSYLNKTTTSDVLSDNDKNLCDKEITSDEVYDAVLLLKKNKSPGLDGLIPEFYQKCWGIIKKHF